MSVLFSNSFIIVALVRKHQVNNPASELLRTSSNIADINKISKYCKPQNSQYFNSLPEIIIKCKLCSCKYKGSCPAYRKIYGHFAKLYFKKGIRLNLNNVSPICNGCSSNNEVFFIGNVDDQNSKPINKKNSISLPNLLDLIHKSNFSLFIAKSVTVKRAPFNVRKSMLASSKINKLLILRTN